MSVVEDMDATELMARIEQAQASAPRQPGSSAAGTGRILLPGQPLGKLAERIGEGDAGAEILLMPDVALPEAPYRVRIGIEEVLVQTLAERQVVEPGLDRRPQVVAWFENEVAPDGSTRRPVLHPQRGQDNPLTYNGKLIGRTAAAVHPMAEWFEVADPVMENLPTGRGPFEVDATGVTLTIASLEQRPKPPVRTGKRVTRMAWQAQLGRGWTPPDALGAPPGIRIPHEAGELLYFQPTKPVIEAVGAASARVEAINDWDGLIIITTHPMAPDAPQDALLARLYWSMGRQGQVFTQALVNSEGRSLAEAALAIRQTPNFVELVCTGLPPVPGRYEVAWTLQLPADRRGQRP